MVNRKNHWFHRQKCLAWSDYQDGIFHEYFNRPVYGLLYRASPYDGIDPSCYADDRRGWWSEDPALEQAITLLKPSLIVEIGTWKGASALFMADICDRFRIAAEIVCVDPYTGGAGAWLHDPDALMLDKGRSGMSELFLANVLRSGHQDRITPFFVTASTALEVFRRKDIRPDMIYIDGSHLERDVYNDLCGAQEVLREGGLIVCDDYKHSRIPGVTRAVEHFMRDNAHYDVIEIMPQSRATEWIAPGDTTLKCILIEKTNPLRADLLATVSLARNSCG
jgi:hypothetical protein